MLTQLIEEFLKKKKWKYFPLEDSNVFLFGITGKSGQFQCVIDLGENEQELALYSICGDRAKTENYDKLLVILNEINYNLLFGNFELDKNDGEIRFRTTMLTNGLELNESFLEEFVLTHLRTMDEQLPMIKAGILI